MIALVIVLAALAAPAWVIRGGSMPGVRAPRWLALMLTPGAIGAAYLVALAASGAWTTSGAVAIAGGSVLFWLAQMDGWGRQMDLGRDAKPDDETGHRIRDLIFDAPSSFERDLVGLYMRMAQFLAAAGVWALCDWRFAAPAAFMAILAPLVWVAEHKLFWSRGTTPPGPFVEIVIGCALAGATCGAAALHMGAL